jgi:hypothetical protein
VGYKLLSYQHSYTSRYLGKQLRNALDGPATHRAAVAEQLGARLTHAHVHARRSTTRFLGASMHTTHCVSSASGLGAAGGTPS